MVNDPDPDHDSDSNNDIARLEEVIDYKSNNVLYVNVEFNDLLSSHSEAEAFRIIGILKDLLQ